MIHNTEIGSELHNGINWSWCILGKPRLVLKISKLRIYFRRRSRSFKPTYMSKQRYFFDVSWV